MNIPNYRISLAVLALSFGVLTAPALAQISFDVPLAIGDNGDGAVPGRDTLYFGVNPVATNGRDAGLGEDEMPPAPPEGVFDVRFVNVGSTRDFGQGTKRNYRKYATADQTDTFRFKVQPGFKPGSSGYPITISWPDLGTYFAAASLRFVDGDGNATTHDMLSSRSFSFSNPSAVTSTVTITTSRPKSASGAVSMAEAMLNLKMTSAPNPARRSDGVSVSYTLPLAAQVGMKLYNTLGQVVATLVDERQEPARRTVRIETSGLPAGSYYCVITAGEFTAACPIVLAD